MLKDTQINSSLRLFRCATSGNVALLLALLAPCLIGAVGLAIDFSRRSQSTATLQTAADAAALAAMRTLEEDPNADATSVAKRVFKMNAGKAAEQIEGVSVNATPMDGSVRVDVDGALHLPFLNVLGVAFTDVSVSSTAARGAGVDVEPKEIALALDLTGSLVFNGVHLDLLAEAKAFVDNIRTSPAASQTYLAIVPFTSVVNVGVDKAAWLSTSNAAAFSPGAWGGCLFARDWNDLDVSDAPPADGLWRPYHWPRSFSSAEPYNDWDGVSAASFANGLANEPFPASQMDDPYDDIGTLGPNLACMTPIRPLSNDHAGAIAFLDGVDEFSFDGGTALSLGAVWAWRTLSPRWRGEWGLAAPADRPADGVRKVMVILSDGAPKWSKMWFHDHHVTGYGLPTDPLPSAENLTDNGDMADRFELVCDNARAAGVEVYTILFASTDAGAAKTMENCAGDPKNFFQAGDAPELAAAFDSVFATTGALRLVK